MKWKGKQKLAIVFLIYTCFPKWKSFQLNLVLGDAALVGNVPKKVGL